MLGFYGYNCGDVYDVSSPNVSRRPNVPSTSRPSAAMTSQLRMEPHRDICWATQNLGLEWGRMKNPNPNLYIYNRGYSYNSHNNIILYIYIILDHINQQPIGWFQTCRLFSIIYGIILPIDELIFFKMVKTTNQLKKSFFGRSYKPTTTRGYSYK